MAAEFKVQRVMPPYLGLDHDSAPDVVAPERAPVYSDWLLDRPGVCAMRGPLSRIHNGSTGGPASKNLVGHAVYDDSVLWGFSTGELATGRIAPWESFWKYAANDSELLQAPAGSTDLLRVSNIQTLTTTDLVAPLGTTVGWGDGTRLGRRVFQPSLESGVGYEDVHNHKRKATVITCWDGGVTTGTWDLASGPNFCIGVRSHYGRLFCAAARDPFGAALAINYTPEYNPHQVYWTNPTTDGITLGALGDWVNPNTFALNKLTVGQQDAGDATVALAKVERNLMIFKRNSAYVLYGYSEDTWAIRQVSSDLGCIDPRSVVESEDQVYFMSARGFYRYDGVRFTDCSKRLHSTLVRYALQACGPNGADGGYVRANAMPGGYIQVTVGIRPYNGAGHTVLFNGYYCIATDSWATFTLADGARATAEPFGAVTLTNRTLMYSTHNYWDASHMFTPELAPTTHYGWDQNPDSGDFAVTSPTLQTKLYALASPLWSSQLNRVLVDYAYVLHSGADDTAAAWSVAVANGKGEILMPTVNMPAAGAGTSHRSRRREVRDVYNETVNAGDLFITVGRAGGAAVSKAELYAMDVLFQTAQERRTQ